MKKRKLKVIDNKGKIQRFVIRNDSEGFIFTVGNLRDPQMLPSIKMMRNVQDMVKQAFKNSPFVLFLPPFVTVKKYKLCKKKSK